MLIRFVKVLYKCFVKETVRKCEGLVDFSATSLLAMRAYMHAHCIFGSLLKTGRKTTLWLIALHKKC